MGTREVGIRLGIREVGMMITQETAARIWSCHREIEASIKLLEDMEESRKKFDHTDERKYAGTLRDAFGRYRDLQLGVPSSNDSHRLFGVSPDLAESIIRAHIANKQGDLVEACEQARIELGGKP
jgi:hypothetical protein